PTPRRGPSRPGPGGPAPRPGPRRTRPGGAPAGPPAGPRPRHATTARHPLTPRIGAPGLPGWPAGVSGLKVAGVFLVALDDAGVGAEERMLRHVGGVTGGRRRLARRLGHGPDVMGRGATTHAQIAHAQPERGVGELAKFLPGAGERVERGGEGLLPAPLRVPQRLHR